MSENKFNTIHVKNLYILENEAEMNRRELRQLSDQNSRIASYTSYPLMIIFGGAGGYLLSFSAVGRTLSQTVSLTAMGFLIGGLAGILLAFLFKMALDFARMDADSLEIQSTTHFIAYSVILKNELSKLTMPYLSKDKAVTYGYEYIDLNHSTSETLILNIPADLTSAADLKEGHPAMRNALDIYIADNQPDDESVLNIVSGLLSTIRYKEDKATQTLTAEFHKDTAQSDAFIQQLEQEKLRLQSEIESLDSTLEGHLKDNQSIIETRR